MIDDFLSESALDSLRRFCLEFTIWFTNCYAHDRLGAFFRDGFSCPLLAQIADETRRAFPNLIGRQHKVEQIWAFKYNNSQPRTSAHADFAAVNLNLWLTPSKANLDNESGGLTIYNVEAPLDWSFNNYNKEGQKISAYLAEQNASCVRIPYAANRAIMFKSNLFHATEPLSFRSGYENKRINVTILFGKREHK